MTAVLFDMDGVLVDSESYWVPLENEEILPRVVPGQDVTADEVTGMNYREIYDYLEDRYETAVSREEFIGLFDDAARDIFGQRASLFPGFEDLLSELRKRNVQVALVTSSPPHWVDIVFDRFDLHNAFDAVISADELDGPGKPDPSVYEYAAAELGVEPDDCIAIEDSSHGIESAHRAGMFVIGFRFGGEPGDGVTDIVAETPRQVREIVLERMSERR